MRSWGKSVKTSLQASETAYQIYQEIVLSLESYSDDSFEPKFFFPEEISSYLQSVAASFTQVLYTPNLSLPEIASSRVYYLLYLSLMYGAQIYLKERAITRTHAPYTLLHDNATVEAIKLTTISHLENKTPVSEEAEIVIHLYLQQMSYVNASQSLSLDGKIFNTENFEKCHLTSLLYGYHFGREMINAGPSILR